MALAVLLAGALGASGAPVCAPDAVIAGARASGAPVCAPDAVIAGARCIDKFEASVWRVPNPTTANAPLVAKIQKGTATGADLSVAGARQLGTAGDDYEPCTDQGESCADLYAVSLLSRGPSAFVTWFQAQEACANSGKRLPTSAEWQVAANGTPDPGPDDGVADCNTGHFPFVDGTGARRRCVSARGAFDMVGNLEEWTADWVAATQICTGWGVFSDDYMCLGGASETDTTPDALLRGGSYTSGLRAGPLAVRARPPSIQPNSIGFRCARELPEPGGAAQLGFGLGLVALARMNSKRSSRGEEG